MLAHEILQSRADPSKTALMLHGILGSKRNLTSFAWRIVKAHPDWRIVLVDLRNHGASSGFSGPHTLGACAQDVMHLGQTLALRFDSIIGHSFGGKVALACAEIARPKQVWVLDTNPGKTPLEHRGHTSVIGVMHALRQIALPLATRKDVVEELVAHGISRPVALWMTTNVKEIPGGLGWNFDLDVIEEMLASYAQTSFWPQLNEASGQIRYDFVRALSENRFSSEELDLFAQASKQGLVHLHGLENSGHWVHIDNPDGLLDIMSPSFES